MATSAGRHEAGRKPSQTTALPVVKFPRVPVAHIDPQPPAQGRVVFALESATAEMQGRRAEMEDAAVCLQHPQFNRQHEIQEDADRSLFAVFDGHGGSSCSALSAKCLAGHVADCLRSSDVDDESVAAAVAEAMALVDGTFIEHAKHHPESENAGSTAIVVLVEDAVITVANIGDSRVVLSHKGKFVDMTQDHKPDRPDEYARVLAAGGTVGATPGEAYRRARGEDVDHLKCCFFSFRVMPRGPPRVFPGGLAVSRSIGDLELRGSNAVISAPEMSQRRLCKHDQFLILACDGVWDVMSSQEAVDVVQKYYSAVPRLPCTAAAKGLIDMAYKLGSTDNISALIVYFKHAL